MRPRAIWWMALASGHHQCQHGGMTAARCFLALSPRRDGIDRHRIAAFQAPITFAATRGWATGTGFSQVRTDPSRRSTRPRHMLHGGLMVKRRSGIEDGRNRSRPKREEEPFLGAVSGVPAEVVVLQANQEGRADLQPVPLDRQSLDKDDNRLLAQAALELWRWCQYFVVPYNLCPWALGSVQTAAEWNGKGPTREAATAPSPMRFYLVPFGGPVVDGDDTDQQVSETMKRAVLLASQEFMRDVLGVENLTTRHVRTADQDTTADSQTAAAAVDPRTAIFFVVFVEEEASNESPVGGSLVFTSFYDWYLELEEEWFAMEEDMVHAEGLITLAPFHPQWSYGDGGEDAAILSIEKQAPWPCVTVVSSRAIEQAGGAAATERVAQNNQQTLLNQPGNRSTGKPGDSAALLAQWKQLYQSAVQTRRQTD